MKHLFWLLFSGLLMNTGASAQSTGLRLDDAAYARAPLPSALSGIKFSTVEPYVSLRKYAAPPADQGDVASCASHAARNQFSMLHAIRRERTAPAELAEHQFSAGYLYNQLRYCKTCDCNTSLTDVLDFLQRVGDCYRTTLPAADTDCTVDPTPAATAEAALHRITGYEALFPAAAPASEKLDAILRYLTDRQPILVALELPARVLDRSFREEVTRLSPVEHTGPLRAHAMVVTGHDLLAEVPYVELLNSFGPAWGNGGYLRLHTTDFSKLLRYGFAVSLPLEPMPAPEQAVYFAQLTSAKMLARTTGKSTLPEVPLLTGNFDFREVKAVYAADGTRRIDRLDAPVNSARTPGVYTLSGRDWKVGDQFQLVGHGMRRGQYVYVYSVDAAGKLERHWPKDRPDVPAASFSALIPVDRAEVILPGVDRTLRLAHSGRDNLVVLYAGRSIENVDRRMERAAPGIAADPSAALRREFGDLLVPSAQIRYAADRMLFWLADPGEGSVVPIVLRVTAGE